jgi:hypothetical protein
MTSTHPKILTFIHRFSRTLSCEMRVPSAPPRAGQPFNPICIWTGGRPKKKHIPEYRQWVLLTNQSLADQWGIRIGYGLGVTAHETEFWCFEPGGPPKLLKKINAGIPCF